MKTWLNKLICFLLCVLTLFGLVACGKEQSANSNSSSNQSSEMLNIKLPKNLENTSWHICLDTSNFYNINLLPKDYIEKDYILNPQSLAVFMEINNG